MIIAADNVAASVRALLCNTYREGSYWECGLDFYSAYENQGVRVVEIITVKALPSLEAMISRHQRTIGGRPAFVNSNLDDDEFSHAALFDKSNRVVGFFSLKPVGLFS